VVLESVVTGLFFFQIAWSLVSWWLKHALMIDTPSSLAADSSQPRETTMGQGTSDDYMDHLKNKLEQNHALQGSHQNGSHSIRKSEHGVWCPGG
jgi:hypothetical protein